MIQIYYVSLIRPKAHFLKKKKKKKKGREEKLLTLKMFYIERLIKKFISK